MSRLEQGTKERLEGRGRGFLSGIVRSAEERLLAPCSQFFFSSADVIPVEIRLTLSDLESFVYLTPVVRVCFVTIGVDLGSHVVGTENCNVHEKLRLLVGARSVPLVQKNINKKSRAKTLVFPAYQWNPAGAFA